MHNIIKSKCLLIKTIYIGIILLIIINSPVFGEKIKELHFYNQPITDILLSLGQIGKRSIVPDETVYGNASFSFVDIEFDVGLKVFLNTYNLYLDIQDNIYYISKIKIVYNEQQKIIASIDAEDVSIGILIDALSREIRKTILKDAPPTISLTIHQQNIGIKEFLELLLQQIPGYELVVNPDYYHVKKVKVIEEETAEKGIEAEIFVKKDNRYTINKEKKRFKELIDELFALEKKEFQLLLQRDALIDVKLRYQDKTFEEMLRLICEQGNADFKQVKDIYYIFEITQRDILKRYQETMILPLKYITAQDLQRLLPPDLGSSRFYRVDTNTNVVILNGSYMEILPIADFIYKLDKPVSGLNYLRYDLNFIKGSQITQLLPDEYKYSRLIQIPDSNSIIIALSDERAHEFDKYIKMLDKSPISSEIRLNYIKAEDLVKNPPPSIGKEDIIQTQDPSIVFLKGSKEKQKAFLRDLVIFDQPAPQIVYHILVISLSNQVQDKTEAHQNYGIVEEKKFSGSLSNLLGISFNIPSVLGWNFAFDINTLLQKEESELIADTTLYALSGEKVNFNDTQIYKTIVAATSQVEGVETTTTVTETTDTGLIIKIDGWASGDGMITMAVDASFKKEGGGTEDTGLPSSTFNKEITTKGRTSSGTPIKIGGLMSETKNIQETKVPILGDIPLIGFLFKSKSETINRGEIIIYILPNVVMTEKEKLDIGRRLNRLYEKYLHIEKEES